MAANATLVRPLPSQRRGRQLALLFGAAIAADLSASLFITHEQGQVVRVFGVAAGIAVVFWFAMGTRSALVAFAASWGLLHSFLFSTSLGGSAGGQSLNLSRALGGAIVLGVGLGLLKLRRRGGRLTPPLVAVTLFLVLYACDAAISPLRSIGAGDAVRVASGILIGIAAFYAFDTRDRLLQLTRAAFLGGVAVAGMTVVQYAITKVSPGAAHAIFGARAFIYSADQAHSNHVARVAGSLGAPGETSGFLVVTASFGLLRYALLRDTARTRGIAAGVALMGLAIVATLTRASTVAFLLLILIWMMQRQLRSVSAVGLRTKILTVLLVLVVLAVPVLGAKTLHTRLWDINPTSSGTGFAQGRGAIWSTEIRRMEASNVPQLLLGHGAHTAELQGYAHGSPIETSPHNLLVWLLIETGVIGTVLYLAFLIGAGRRYRAAARWRRFEDAGRVGAVALAALIAYQVQGMFLLSPTSPGHGIYFMLFVGATLRACTAAPATWRAASAQID
jgi:O-Antigen ligase